MKLKLVTSLFFSLFLGLGIVGQVPQKDVATEAIKKTSDEVITIKSKVTKSDYEDLLAKLKKGDTTINFAKLRLAFTETKNYAPYGGAEERGKMYQSYRDRDCKASMAVASKMLETNYVEISAHFISWRCSDELGDKAAAERHQKIYNGLMAAIQQNDGLSEKTAMISIGIAEQYFVMGQMGFTRESKALINSGGSAFDVHTAVNATKETRKFYFNIDKVFGRF